MQAQSGSFFVCRLFPGTDIKSSLESLLKANQMQGGAIVSCVGSVRYVKLRLANAAANLPLEDCSLEISKPMEIVSFSGTLSVDGLHLHMSVSDENGNVFGGHLVQAHVHTTCEVVLVRLPTLRRLYDVNTGFKELVIV